MGEARAPEGQGEASLPPGKRPRETHECHERERRKDEESFPRGDEETEVAPPPRLGELPKSPREPRGQRRAEVMSVVEQDECRPGDPPQEKTQDLFRVEGEDAERKDAHESDVRMARREGKAQRKPRPSRPNGVSFCPLEPQEAPRQKQDGRGVLPEPLARRP